MNFNEVPMEHNPFCLNLSTHGSRLPNSNSIEESCPSSLRSSRMMLALAASLEHPETHWVDSSGGVGIMICGPLLKHSKVIMAKKLALSQKGHRNEAAAPNSCCSKWQSYWQGVVQECLTPCIMWLELQVGVTP